MDKKESQRKDERGQSEKEWENLASFEENKDEVFQGGAMVRPTENRTENV